MKQGRSFTKPDEKQLEYIKYIEFLQDCKTAQVYLDFSTSALECRSPDQTTY